MSELCHYGVKGMKWGRRKSKSEREAAYVDKWRKKESRKIAKRRLKQIKSEGKQITKATNKYHKELDGKHREKKLTKLASKYINTKSAADARDKIARAEVKKVMNMNMADIKKERREVGKHVFTASLINLANIPLAALGSPRGVIATVNRANVKTASRVSGAEQAYITRQAFEDAANEVYAPRKKNRSNRR